MKVKWSYIVISLLLISNLIAFGYIEKYCEVNQQQRDKTLLHSYLLKLTNDISGDMTKLKHLYPNLVIKNNKIIINKHSIFRNSHYTKHFKKVEVNNFHGFEFIVNNKEKIISSDFYQP